MAQEQQARTVTQALNAAKRSLEQLHLTMVGEVSEFSNKAGYKAVYFTLRDDESACPCLMWRSVFDASGVNLYQGALVEVDGMFTCYPAKGRMQFQVRRLRMAGEGDLRLRVAQTARKLEAEGLMSPERKRTSPALPSRIALVTSPRGKAVRDCLRTLRRRYPLGEVLVYGVPVEGEQAVPAMIEALQAAQRTEPAPDVILLVRGGGSYEELMPFNDERLARAVAASSIPVVTGIGHEPDNSIVDMVADRRCSTPTAAAEAVALSVEQLRAKLRNAKTKLTDAYERRVEGFAHRLVRLGDRPLWHDAHYLTGGWGQALDGLQERLERALPQAFAARGVQLDNLELRLQRAVPGALEARQHALTLQSERLQRALPQVLQGCGHALDGAASRLRGSGKALTAPYERSVALGAAKLDALSPLKTLARGYSITYGPDGRQVVDSVDKAAVGQDVTVQVQDGHLDCTVTGIERCG